MARTIQGKLLAEQRKRDKLDPVVMYIGGTFSHPERYCKGCGPRYLDHVAPMRVSDMVENDIPNGLCHHCGLPLLRP